MNLKRSRPSLQAAWLLLIPLLLACQVVTNIVGRDTESTPSETPASTAVRPEGSLTAAPSVEPAGDVGPSETVTYMPPPTPPVSPSPTSESPRLPVVSTLLPAPLYFIGENGQIMRLEADGRSLRQITDEPAGILDFDISPYDARLVYISGNRLVETAPDGQNPIVKVDADPIADDGTGEVRLTRAIDRPRFSPDGTQIVFGLNGLNLMLAGSPTEYAVLLPSDPFPHGDDPNRTGPGGMPSFYWPVSWSPDGRRFLFEIRYYPESGALGIFDLDTHRWQTVTNEDDIDCCDWAWSANGRTGFVASDRIAYGMPGLAQVDPATGAGLTLIHGAPETPGVTGLPPSIQVFRAPFVAGSDGLYTFVAIGYQDDPLQPLMHMARLPAGASETLPMRDDEYLLVDYLWSADGRGAVIAGAGPSSVFPKIGPLRWLPADGSPAVDLPASGGVLRWGPPGQD